VCVERFLVFWQRDGTCFCEVPKSGFKFGKQLTIACYIFLEPEYNNTPRPLAGHDEL